MRADISLLLDWREDIRQSGVVVLDKDNRVNRFIENYIIQHFRICDFPYFFYISSFAQNHIRMKNNPEQSSYLGKCMTGP